MKPEYQRARQLADNSALINATENSITGLNFNEVASTGTTINHVYSNKSISTGTDFKLMDVSTQPNRNYTYYPRIVDCSPQCLTVEMTKEMVIAMNAMMKIKDVEILIPNKVVRVTFNDGTFEKAICHEEDMFNLDTAIGVCIAKRLCGGSAKFNNLVNKGIKLYNAKLKAEEEVKLEQDRIEAKRKKYQEKKAKRLARKAEEERDARIKEQAEAIMLAHELMNTKSIDNEFHFDEE